MINYDPFSKPDPTIAEFREMFEHIAEESSVDGKIVNSHTLKTVVSVSCENDHDASYELVGMDVDQMIGCGCWVGPRLIIRRIKN